VFKFDFTFPSSHLTASHRNFRHPMSSTTSRLKLAKVRTERPCFGRRRLTANEPRDWSGFRDAEALTDLGSPLTYSLSSPLCRSSK
jgi:hypothetical protein